MQVGVDVTGEAVQRAGRKVAAAYKQAQDPLSAPLQQLGGLAEGARKTAGASASKQLPSAQLYHGDIATANARKPGECCAYLTWIKHYHPQKAERQLLRVIGHMYHFQSSHWRHPLWAYLGLSMKSSGNHMETLACLEH